MFTDTHCHIYSEYYDDIDDIIKLSELKGVNRYINNGCNSKTNKEILELIKKYPNMYGALGIHPEDIDTYSLDDIKFIEDNLVNDKVIAIGEIGLDYHYSKENKEEQIKLFELQLELAEKYHKPVIVHSREATLDTINILKKYKVKGVIHSFSGSLESAREYIKMGYLIGINGVITFKNCNLKDVVNNLEVSNIVLETDSPYLTPTPDRGKQNNPGYIKEIAEFVANIYNMTLDDLAKRTNENIKKMFNI